MWVMRLRWRKADLARGHLRPRTEGGERYIASRPMQVTPSVLGVPAAPSHPSLPLFALTVLTQQGPTLVVQGAAPSPLKNTPSNGLRPLCTPQLSHHGLRR
jgi:hypothetical protein